MLVSPVAAAGAVPVEFVAMSQDFKSIGGRDLVLRLLDHLALKFRDLPAFDADQMIVVFVLDFIARDAVVEMALGGEPRLHQELHGAVDGRVSNIRVLGADRLIEVLTRHVALRLEECLKNQLALLRLLEMILFEVGGQCLQLGFMGHRASVSRLGFTFSRPAYSSRSSARDARSSSKSSDKILT